MGSPHRCGAPAARSLPSGKNAVCNRRLRKIQQRVVACHPSFRYDNAVRNIHRKGEKPCHWENALHPTAKKAGYSQEGLAEQLGVSRQAVSKWETGGSLR